MTPRMALSRILTDRRDAEHWRRHAADQTRLNGELARACAAKDREIADLREQVKQLKDERGRLAGFLVTALMMRGRAAHEVRRLTAVKDPADAGGGEAA